MHFFLVMIIKITFLFLVDVVSTPPTPKTICRYYPHCKMPPGTCPYFHPTSMAPCRFGAACLHRGTTCPFVHPTPTVIPSVNKLKWVAPGRSSTNRNPTNPPGASGASTIGVDEPALAQSAEVITT